MVSRLPWVSRRDPSKGLRQLFKLSYLTWRRWVLQLSGKHLIWTTKEGVEIAVEKGKKSPYDFKVRFREPGKRWWRTPEHVHLIVELYVKEARYRELTLQLRDHLLQVFQQVQPINYFPPKLQFFKPSHAESFELLNSVGEMSVEFLLVVSELIFIQEKTNYPAGSLTYELYESFGTKDRFSVVQRATFKNR
jgi:hypothetical protein